MNTCKQCGIEIPQTYYKKIFCSKSCAAIFNNTGRIRSAESKLIVSITMKNLINSGIIPKPSYPKKEKRGNHTKLYGYCQCNSCNNYFWQTSYRQRCCSKQCRDNICSQNKCRKTHIPYFNIYSNKQIDLQSSWELEIAIWFDENNIKWSRPTTRFKWFNTLDSKTKTYLPDFFLVDYNVYLDVKNPIKIQQDEYKLNQLKKIIPLTVGNIEEIKQYVACLAGLEPA